MAPFDPVQMAGGPPMMLTPEELDHMLGVPPMPLDQQSPPAYHISPLGEVIQGFAGWQPSRAPRNFGEGLVGGFGRGLGNAGARSLQARQEFDANLKEQQKTRDAANLKATQDLREARIKGYSDFTKDKRTQADKQTTENDQNPLVDDAMIKRYGKLIPNLASSKGQRFPKKLLDEATARQTPEQLAADAKAKKVAETAATPDESPMTDDDLKIRARMELGGGSAPAWGMGKQGAANRARYVHIFGDVVREGGIDPGQVRAMAVAEKGNLAKLVATQGGAGAFAQTAEKNLTRLEKHLDIPDVGIRWGNHVVRDLARQFGNTGPGRSMQAFDTIRGEVIPELARLINSPSAAGLVTNEMQAQVNTMQDPDSTIDQIKEAIKQFRAGYKARIASYDEAIAASNAKIASLSGTPALPSTRTAGQPQALPDDQAWQHFQQVTGGH